MAEERSYLVPAANRGEEIRFQHPLNPNSEIHGHQLGRLAGLRRTGVNLIRLPPGKESFIYHSHETEEEGKLTRLRPPHPPTREERTAGLQHRSNSVRDTHPQNPQLVRA